VIGYYDLYILDCAIRYKSPSLTLDRCHLEMVFLAHLGVNLHVYLCGDLQVASAQTLDFLEINQKSSFPDWKLGSTGKLFPDGY